MDWNITENKRVLANYAKLRVKKLNDIIKLDDNTWSVRINRCYYKMIYEKKNQDGSVIGYDVFINYVKPIHLKFWGTSVYDYEEIYPTQDDFNYRAWFFTEKRDAFKKYLAL